MQIIKNILSKYKWYLISFILGAGLLLIALSAKDKRAGQRLLRWTLQKRFEMAEEAVQRKKQDADEFGEEFESIERQLKEVRQRKDEVGESVDAKTLQDLSKIWKGLGY